MEGYKSMFKDTIVTVWSAPNYCYRCNNVAAILELDEHLNRNYRIFEAAPQVQYSKINNILLLLLVKIRMNNIYISQIIH